MNFTQEHLAGRPDMARRAFELAGVTFTGRRAGAEYRVPCPFHNDKNPSLDINLQKAVHFCRACGKKGDAVQFYAERNNVSDQNAIADLRKGLGLETSRTEPKAPVAAPPRSANVRYETRDATGTLIATHVFKGLDAYGKKIFPWEPSGVKTAELPLYGSELLAAKPDAPVIITEGEKAAKALIDRNFVAAGTVTGASGTPGSASLEILRGREVTLWPDFDKLGAEHMDRIALALQSVAAVVRILHWGEQKTDDAFDFFARDGTEERLDGMLAEAADYVPKAETVPAALLGSAPGAHQAVTCDRVDSWPPTGWLNAADVLRGRLAPGQRISTGFPILDEATGGGFPVGKSIVLQGAPGSGKTTFAEQVALRAARAGLAVVAMLVPDGGLDDAVVRLGQQVGVDRKRLEAGDPEAILEVERILAEANFWFVPLGDPEAALIENVAEHFRNAPADLARILVSDSIQTCGTVAGRDSESIRIRVEFVMRTLLRLAHTIPLLSIAISQVNRSSYRNKKDEDNATPLSSGAESRAIEFDCDALYHFQGDPSEGPVRFSSTQKNRIGSPVRIGLLFDKDTATFTEVDRAIAEAQATEHAGRAAAAARQSAAARIHEALRKAQESGKNDGWVSTSALLAAAGGTEATVRDTALMLSESVPPTVERDDRGRGVGVFWRAIRSHE